MSIKNLYNGIYKSLSTSQAILSLLDIDTKLESKQLLLAKASKIKKEALPKSIQSGMPMITYHVLPGRRQASNSSVYTTAAVFNVYTKNDVDRALDIGDAIINMFEGSIPSDVSGLTVFESHLQTAHESVTDMPDCYCFTVVIDFAIELEY